MNVENAIRHLVVGQTIIIKLNEGIVIGELLLKKIPSHLRLKNCRDYKTNEDLGVNNIYYINEIRDVRLIQENNTEKEKFDETPVVAEEHEAVKKLQNKICIKLRDDKLNNIREMLQTRVFINKYDARYFNACKDMLNQRQIGVRFENVQFGRRSKASILAIATDHTIYVFDLLHLGEIKKELKEVFESNNVCKIIHYSKMTYDYLKHACNIKLHLVFDTLMAYFYVSGSREVISTTDLVAILFNLPQMEPSKDVIWDSRPITEDVIAQAAFSVAFLIEIQQYLMHRHLLQEFYKASAIAMCHFSNTTEYPYAVKAVKGKEFVTGLEVQQNEGDPIDLREKIVEGEETSKNAE